MLKYIDITQHRINIELKNYCRKRAAKEKRVPLKEGEEGYDPYDFDESEATASEGLYCVMHSKFTQTICSSRFVPGVTEIEWTAYIIKGLHSLHYLLESHVYKLHLKKNFASHLTDQNTFISSPELKDQVSFSDLLMSICPFVCL